MNTWQTKLIQNYSQVLDDATYAQDMLPRRAMFSYERSLLRSCLDNLATTREEYAELIRRCGPLSDSTKQSLEITEEDHGKAIMVFTTVTVIFLPLSFVTSYLGMNTNDIRNMNNRQSLFWVIALPLTLTTMAVCLYISYKGATLRDQLSSLYRAATGKEDQSTSARGISVAQRKRARVLPSNTSSMIDTSTLEDEAEYASPQPEFIFDEYSRKATMATYLPESGKAIEYGFDPEPVKASMPPPQSRIAYTSHLDPPMTKVAAAAQEYTRPTWTRIEKRFIEAETLLHFGYTFDDDPSAPNFFLIKAELTDADKVQLFQHTAQLRSGTAGGLGGASGRHYDAGYETDYHVPPVRSRHVFPPAQRINLYDAYDADEGNEGAMPGYTWHKKHSRRQMGRARHVGPRGREGGYGRYGR